MELLYLELDALTQLRKRAEKELITEARQHREYRIVKSCPGLGPIRTAKLLAIVVTPYRFANKRGFWSYCGLAIVMRSSSDWVRTRGGEWIKAPVQQMHGLNRNFNRTLKHIFKGAATTVISRAEDETAMPALCEASRWRDEAEPGEADNRPRCPGSSPKCDIFSRPKCDIFDRR
ncbi:MAG: transposase [Gemmatimonadetes bacterium]|nr:transposase [Gemmatimonadota bacterium]